MSRPLPGVYTSLRDLSQIANGPQGLAVGMVLKSNKGPIGSATLQSSIQALLANYTFSGVVSPTDDTSFHTAIQILSQTNQLYVTRAAKNALYGGLVVQVTGQPIPFNQIQLGVISVVNDVTNAITIPGNVLSLFQVDSMFGGDKVEIRDNANVSQGIFTVSSTTVPVYDDVNNITVITFKETMPNTVVASQTVYRNSIANPNTYSFGLDDLFIVTGIDQGSYNSELAININSNTNEAGTMQLNVVDTASNATVESYLFSRDMSLVSANGTNTYIEDVVSAGSYNIRVVNNINGINTVLPEPTTGNVSLSGGYNGDALQSADLVEALQVFQDKATSISILANGSIEDPIYQAALIDIANTRQDCFAFINSRLVDEQAYIPSNRATNIANYKLQTLASTSFFAAMYAPHVTVPDVFNSRQVKIGADAKAIPGWLSVINNYGYPFACAGPTYGQIQGATLDWKITPMSGEASTLNNASVNFISFNPIQGNYSLRTQNTLQMANSVLRDIGVVLNVIAIKQDMATLLEKYIEVPITSLLRSNILDDGKNYMNTILASGRVANYAFQDVSTDSDVSNDILRYILTISPTKYAQEMYLTVNNVNGTFDFKILQGQ